VSRLSPLWLAGGLGAALVFSPPHPPTPIAGPRPAPWAVSARVLRAHVEFLADDALEGRGTGARGGLLAGTYIAAQFERLGLEPAGERGTWFQRVPLTARRFAARLEIPGDSGSFAPSDDFILYLPGDDTAAAVSAPAVFVGYGVTAPEVGWDDYRDADVRGKVVVALAGTPAERDSSLFRGARRTDYGLRQYKVDEAARHGAAGALVVYRAGAVPIPWEDIVRAWAGDQMRLADQRDTGRPALRVAGWLNTPAADRLAARSGLELDRLAESAATPGFRALPLGTTVALAATSARRQLDAFNVIARLPGRGPRAGEAVVLGAHYDHLGIGPPVNGDSIYNGAIDNASGSAGMLAVAEALVESGVRPARSVLFVGFGAEELGLLGSQEFVSHPPVPLGRIVAMVNLDALNLLAPTRDISALGSELSSLGDLFRRAALAEGYAITPRDAPIVREAVRQRFFDRADQVSFARAGVPAIFLYFGDRIAGRSAGSSLGELRRYLEDRYHRPNDDLTQPLDYRAGVRPLRVVARTVLAAAEAPDRPRWAPGAPYRRP